jgi:hypothetical protein
LQGQNRAIRCNLFARAKRIYAAIATSSVARKNTNENSIFVLMKKKSKPTKKVVKKQEPRVKTKTTKQLVKESGREDELSKDENLLEDGKERFDELLTSIFPRSR